jgi:hypothetical protein
MDVPDGACGNEMTYGIGEEICIKWNEMTYRTGRGTWYLGTYISYATR